MMYGYGFPWMGGIAMMIFWVLVVAGIVWAIIAVSRNAGQTGQTATRVETPVDVLRRRFAAGEINKEQFEEMKRALGV